MKTSSLSESCRQFLEKVGQRNAYAFKDSGKPTPELVYDQFKILSMLETALATASEPTLAKINSIADWKQ